MAQPSPIQSWKGPAETTSTPVYRPSTAPSGPSTSVPRTHDTQSHDYERPNTPPPYSGPTSPSMRTQTSATTAIAKTKTYPGLPHLDYTLYHPPAFTLSADSTLLSSHSKPLSRDPWKLSALIQSLASIPPKPHVRIVGTSDIGAGFDIKLNLMNLLVPFARDGDGKGRTKCMNYVKVISDGELGFRGATKTAVVPDHRSLDEWCRMFCEDSSALKQFTLERTITNWDTTHLKMLLLSLLASTDYRGQIKISFPLTHSHVTIHAPHKYNSFFSSITEVFTGIKKYEVVKSVWPYADVARGEEGRKCVVQSEEQWFEDWKGAIRHAVLLKRSGWVTVEDRLEELMEPRAVVGG